MDHSNAPFEVIKYVNLDAAEKMIDTVMKRFFEPI